VECNVEANFMVMGGICCKKSQVNAADNCTEQCPTAQFMNENRICKDCPSNRIVNAAKDKCLTSCAAALPEAEITNAAGNACLTNCSSAGEITNTAGDACLTSCTDGGEISDSDGNNQCNGNCAEFEAKLILNAEGNACVPDCKAFGLFLNLVGDGCVFDCNPQFINVACEQCVTECNKVEKQLINVAGDSCVNVCEDEEFISLLGNRCLALCPFGSHQNATNPAQCECSIIQFISVNGEKCLTECPYYAEDHDLDHHCDG
jgi:hypothetical protein